MNHLILKTIFILYLQVKSEYKYLYLHFVYKNKLNG